MDHQKKSIGILKELPQNEFVSGSIYLFETSGLILLIEKFSILLDFFVLVLPNSQLLILRNSSFSSVEELFIRMVDEDFSVWLQNIT